MSTRPARGGSRPQRARKTTRRPAAPRPPGRWWTRGGSGIHGRGLFAARDIPRGTKVIEYVGVRLTKTEGWKRAADWMEKARGTAKGAVYVFEVNSRWDLDGNVPWNTARLINHSCEPNCEPHVRRSRIWIIARRRIRAGEEITYDYGYDFDRWEEHPCRCGSVRCVGYIVAREHRVRLKRALARRRARAMEKSVKNSQAGRIPRERAGGGPAPAQGRRGPAVE